MKSNFSFSQKISAMAMDTEALRLQGSNLLLLAFTGLGLIFSSGFWFGVFGVAFCVLLGMSFWLVRQSFMNAEKDMTTHKFRTVKAWVREGRNAKERRERREALEMYGTDHVFESAKASGFNPGVNINGLPMTEAGVDIHGNPYGVTGVHETWGGSHSISSDVTGYTPPVGMNDPSHF